MLVRDAQRSGAGPQQDAHHEKQRDAAVAQPRHGEGLHAHHGQGDEDSADDHRRPSQRLHEGVGSPSGARDVHLYVEGAHELVGEADEGHAEHDAEDEARDLAMLVGVGEGVLVGQLDDADLRRLADTADGSPQGNSRADGQQGGEGQGRRRREHEREAEQKRRGDLPDGDGRCGLAQRYAGERHAEVHEEKRRGHPRQHPGAGNEERALRGWKTAEGHGQRREHGARRRDPESAPAGEQASCAVLEVADEQQREGKHRDGNQVHRV